jgi:threonylcarbamoyladenosine tRNA methylthiotransferase MtaB
MARKVTPRSYADLINAAREAIPQVSITTDLIAGFPGETETEFAETMEFVERMSFSGGHVFTYSARPGTAAAGMAGQVAHAIRKSRNAALRDLLSRSAQIYAERFLLKSLPVLWETCKDQRDGTCLLEGLTDNYLHVSARSPQPRWNQIDTVCIRSMDAAGLIGEINS